MSSAAYRIALRADASPRAGTGHVRRCLALAAALRDVGAQVCLVTRELGIDAGSMARDAGVERIALPAPVAAWAGTDDAVAHAGWAEVAWSVDAEQTIAALAPWRADALIVDHYAFDARWHRRIADALGVRLTVIDDLADRPLAASCLIDHNFSADHRHKYAGLIDAGTALLGGPRFALLGPAYASAPHAAVHDRVASIGIFMGGVDAANLSTLALLACREHARFDGPIEIAATRAHPQLAALSALARRWRDTTVSVDLPELAGFFARHGLQIGAGGGATWERCCVGAPMLLLQGADNQQVVVRELAAVGAAAAIDCASHDAAAVGREIARLLGDPVRRRSLAQHARALVDGKGARRAAVAIAAPSLALRPAQPDDAARSFAWRNDPATRGVSRDEGALTLDGHTGWWHAALRDPARRLFIAQLGRSEVGVLRLDAQGAHAEVSIYLDPALKGLGLGQAMLRAAQAWAREHSSLERLDAHIRPGNAASERAFAGAGFERGDPCWTWRVRAAAEHTNRRDA